MGWTRHGADRHWRVGKSTRHGIELHFLGRIVEDAKIELVGIPGWENRWHDAAAGVSGRNHFWIVA